MRRSPPSEHLHLKKGEEIKENHRNNFKTPKQLDFGGGEGAFGLPSKKLRQYK